MDRLSGLGVKSGCGFFILKFKMASKKAAKSEFCIYFIENGLDFNKNACFSSFLIEEQLGNIGRLNNININRVFVI